MADGRGWGVGGWHLLTCGWGLTHCAEESVDVHRAKRNGIVGRFRSACSSQTALLPFPPGKPSPGRGLRCGAVRRFPLEGVPGWTHWDHGVNNAMATKSGAVWARQSHDAADIAVTYVKLRMQDTYHGQPHGMFSADECFGGRGLNRGIELCAVVEQMYSLQVRPLTCTASLALGLETLALGLRPSACGALPYGH